MKAIVCERYGSPDVLRLKEVERPAPKEDEVLIRIHAASINSRDWRLMRANPFFLRFMVGGLFKPKNPILGLDAAGRVEAVGGKVRQFRPGDEIFGGLNRRGGRTFAEYACAAESEIAPKPANLSFEQAAAVPVAALTALQGLRDKGNLRPGQKVLIHGASGGVGTFAVQIAKALGAEVTGVCSTRNVEMVRSIGADHVVDYRTEDFARGGRRYDLILAVNGSRPISDYLRVINPGGTYVVAGGSMLQLMQAAVQGRCAPRPGGIRAQVVSCSVRQSDLFFIKDLLESGKVRPVIDGCYPLEKTAEAFRYFEDVHPKGKVVLTMK
jgi:NADPH:quinone reductase-like Zn-dependent oxidoreductase